MPTFTPTQIVSGQRNPPARVILSLFSPQLFRVLDGVGDEPYSLEILGAYTVRLIQRLSYFLAFMAIWQLG